MSSVSIVHTQAFEDSLIEIGSLELARHVERLEILLGSMPDMGSPQLRESLVSRYGKGLRKLVVGNYDVIYRHEGMKVIMLVIVPVCIIQ